MTAAQSCVSCDDDAVRMQLGCDSDAIEVRMHRCLIRNDIVAYDGASFMPEQHHLWLQLKLSRLL